jgi:hypothetical protein
MHLVKHNLWQILVSYMFRHRDAILGGVLKVYVRSKSPTSSSSLVILYTKPTCCTIFLSMFISFLYMFRATMCPSSGETNVFMRHLVLSIVYGWLPVTQSGMRLFHSTLHTRQPSIQNTKYQVSHKYICFSWWWAHRRPNHVEKEINILRKIVHQVGFIYKKMCKGEMCFSKCSALAVT